MDTITNISVSQYFWIQFGENLISFGSEILPEHIHFTVSFDNNSPYINFHITRNTGLANKPKITIVKIKKDLLEEIGESLYFKFLSNYIEPLNLEELRNKEGNLNYISFNQNEEEQLKSEKLLIDTFKDISKIKKKSRLKIEGNLEEHLEKIINADEYQNVMLERVVEIPTEFKNAVESGVVFSETKSYSVININGKWFKFKPNITISELLKGIISKDLLRNLIWKSKRAIVSLQKAQTFEDTKHLNNLSIELKRIKPIITHTV
jgi:hypothetical protein